jgi:hypothetical protein
MARTTRLVASKKQQGNKKTREREFVGLQMIFGANQELLNLVREILAVVSPFVGIHRVQRWTPIMEALSCHRLPFVSIVLLFHSLPSWLLCKAIPFSPGTAGFWKVVRDIACANLAMYWIVQDVSFRGVMVVRRLCPCCDYEFVLNKRFELCGR